MSRLSTISIGVIFLAVMSLMIGFHASGNDEGMNAPGHDVEMLSAKVSMPVSLYENDNWPSWRGHDSSGVSATGNPPVTWSETKNIKWKVELKGDPSGGSPIIWGDKIFFQTAVKTDVKGKVATPVVTEGARRRRGPGGARPSNIYKFSLVCLNRNTGEQLWEKLVCAELPHEGHHRDHGFASFTPFADGKHIWSSFGSRGIYCHDLEGNQIWSKDLGKMNTRMAFGEGGSFTILDDYLITLRDHEGDSFIVALNKMSGDILWRKDRDESTTWATPLPIEVNGKMQVVTAATNFTRSYDPKTGDIIWQCSGLFANVIPTPVTGHGMVFCTSGHRGHSLQAIELGHTGDLSGTDAVKWSVTDRTTPYVPSPILYEERIYVCAVNNPVVSCYNAKTGEPYFLRQQIDQLKGIYSSPVAAAGRVYFVGRNGVTGVLKASDKFEVLSTNTLDDAIDASPAIIGDELYLKGKKYFYCIAEEN